MKRWKVIFCNNIEEQLNLLTQDGWNIFQILIRPYYPKGYKVYTYGIVCFRVDSTDQE